MKFTGAPRGPRIDLDDIDREVLRHGIVGLMAVVIATDQLRDMPIESQTAAASSWLRLGGTPAEYKGELDLALRELRDHLGVTR